MIHGENPVTRKQNLPCSNNSRFFSVKHTFWCTLISKPIVFTTKDTKSTKKRLTTLSYTFLLKIV